MAGKKHRCLSLDEKVNLIQASVTHKLSVKALQELFQCGKTQVYSTLQRKAEIMQTWMEGPGYMKRKIKAKNEEINRLTWEWFKQERSKNISIQGPMVQAKAKELAEQQGNFLFKASNGWLESFKNRHKIRWKEMHGMSNNVAGISVQENYRQFNNINVESVQETCWEFNDNHNGSVQEMCVECPDVKVEIVEETCDESDDVDVESVQETCVKYPDVKVEIVEETHEVSNDADGETVQEMYGEYPDIKVEIVEETCQEYNDDDESVQETCGEFNYVNVESVQPTCGEAYNVKVEETCEESNNVNVEMCGESHNGNNDTESDNIISRLDTGDINKTIPSVRTYSEALQHVMQLEKFALTANDPELLQSFLTSKHLIEQALVTRKIRKEKLLNG